MMPTRKREDIPWDDIEEQVEKAIDECNKDLRFVKVANIAKYVMSLPDEYPLFAECTYKTTQFRITMSLGPNGLNWPRFTTKGNRSTVFINPKVEA